MTQGAADEDRFSRALSAFVRAEVQAPVAVLSDRIDMLGEDAAAAGLTTYAADLAKMRAACERFSGLVSALLDQPDDDARAASVRTGKLRHDLRTPISAVLGYAELIAEEARDGGDTLLLEPLADAIEAAGRLLKQIDELVALSDAGDEAASATGGAAGTVLPEVLRQAVEVANRLAQHEPATRAGAVGRILVVDDNPSMRDLIARRVAREGHEVSVCGSGQVALDMTAGGAFDLLLLDLMMPGMDGIEVLQHLRARAEGRGLPVIVISALDESEVAVRCIELGADDVLSKPINGTLLRARIGASLERKFLRDREQEAARLLRLEQERSESLLRNVLPAGVVQRLRGGEAVIADSFEEVTVLFCDLVGFTALSARQRPADTLDLLNAIFSGFDALAEANGLEKIKTIGDAYMVVGGIPEPVADHARRVVTMARGMAGVLAAAGGGETLAVRIGVATGPAAAGIIGTRKFFYDVWGDTVNTASRLEAACEPGRIHVSAATRAAAGEGFVFEAREPLEVRGKGTMRTFYVAA